MVLTFPNCARCARRLSPGRDLYCRGCVGLDRDERRRRHAAIAHDLVRGFGGVLVVVFCAIWMTWFGLEWVARINAGHEFPPPIGQAVGP